MATAALAPATSPMTIESAPQSHASYDLAINSTFHLSDDVIAIADGTFTPEETPVLAATAESITSLSEALYAYTTAASNDSQPWSTTRKELHVTSTQLSATATADTPDLAPETRIPYQTHVQRTPELPEVCTDDGIHIYAQKAASPRAHSSLIKDWHTHKVAQRPYPQGLRDKQVIDETHDKLHAQGRMEYVHGPTPFAAPVFVVWRTARGETKGRVVIDLRALNKVTMPDSYPLPLQEDIIQELMYGFPLKGPLEAVDRTASAEADELPYIKEALRKQASLAMDLAAMKAKRWYDAKHRPIHLKAGDKVYLKLHQGYHQPGRPPKKWSQQREGPFVIRRMVGDLACELDLPEQNRVHPVISIHHLKPAHEGCFEEAHPGPVEATKDFTDQEGEFYEVDKLLDVRVRKIGRNRKPVTEYLVHWKGWGSMHDQWIRKEEEVDKLKRGRKRRAIPNPNRRFMCLAEALAAGEIVPEIGGPKKAVVVDCDSEEEEVESDTETAPVIEVKVSGPPQRTTRLGRVIKRPRTY
ncbi:chromatin organization modifier domain-containing protein [Hirsutella rhossiliensis]|uniref:Chromo (CHRromatin organization MOdifier) domain-containing protein n=1 Tax=Hirsutella rhossiliensis TaxID=111463 RepID=A0A9P8MRA6_9HYPO|nr:chromo (CHRromatin organization MOdifier) domain-containing protein [Hirsutella rhossiliensis]KAH0960398.1 chromo (CHRromatin organization MOdifier) domain-containing protein [Hirsutella rhossiliensis]